MTAARPPSPGGRRSLEIHNSRSRGAQGFSPGRAGAGAALAAIGLIGLAAQVALLNCNASACETAIVDIGLALGVAISAIAQAALLTGLWLIWTSRRR